MQRSPAGPATNEEIHIRTYISASVWLNRLFLCVVVLIVIVNGPMQCKAHSDTLGYYSGIPLVLLPTAIVIVFGFGFLLTIRRAIVEAWLNPNLIYHTFVSRKLEVVNDIVKMEVRETRLNLLGKKWSITDIIVYPSVEGNYLIKSIRDDTDKDAIRRMCEHNNIMFECTSHYESAMRTWFRVIKLIAITLSFSVLFVI